MFDPLKTWIVYIWLKKQGRGTDSFTCAIHQLKWSTCRDFNFCYRLRCTKSHETVTFILKLKETIFDVKLVLKRHQWMEDMRVTQWTEGYNVKSPLLAFCWLIASRTGEGDSLHAQRQGRWAELTATCEMIESERWSDTLSGSKELSAHVLNFLFVLCTKLQVEWFIFMVYIFIYSIYIVEWLNQLFNIYFTYCTSFYGKNA